MNKLYLGFVFAAGIILPSRLSAQGQITTPSGQPLIIGNNGVRISNLNSGSAVAPWNGKVLSLDNTGSIILVKDSLGTGGGGGGGWVLSGSNAYSGVSGNIGIGTTNPQYKLQVEGDVNLPASGSLRFGGIGILRAPGGSNIFLGNSTGLANSGTNNIFMGTNAGKANTSASGNSFIGWTSGQENTTGFYNTFLGPAAGTANTTASYNTFIGPNTGLVNTTGEKNVFIGPAAGADNVSGGSNVFIGPESGRHSLGFFNSYIGTNAGTNSTSGSGNTFIGYDAGKTNTTGYYNTAIGNQASVGATFFNSTAIGAGAVAGASNVIVLGNGTNVGIGVSAPSAKLEVKSGTPGASGLKFTDMTSGSPGTIVTATRFLTVDGSGNVVLGSTSGGREAASFAENWKLDATTKSLSNSNEGAVVIGRDLLKLPGSYRLFVQEGILTERVKVALKGTDDWSDKVFAPTYKLRGLNEVEQFIKENNHLPGIPSAAEMVKSGNDLHKTDAILLEKIEELTLYMIQLKKENEKLRKEVDQLKQDKN